MIHEYPKIKEAMTEVALDNGMVNREETIESLYEKMTSVIAADGITKEDLDKLEVWLSGLNDVDLEIVCCGEYKEAQKITESCPTGGPDNTKLTGLLDDFFCK